MLLIVELQNCVVQHTDLPVSMRKQQPGSSTFLVPGTLVMQSMHVSIPRKCKTCLPAHTQPAHRHHYRITSLCRQHLLRLVLPSVSGVWHEATADWWHAIGSSAYACKDSIVHDAAVARSESVGLFVLSRRRYTG